MWPGSAKTGSGLPWPKGPARSIVSIRPSVAPPADSAPSMARPDWPRAPAATGIAEPLLQEGAEGAEIGSRERDAGRHGMAAALGEKARLDGGADGAAEIDAGDRAARTGAERRSRRRRWRRPGGRSAPSGARRPGRRRPGCQLAEAVTMAAAAFSPGPPARAPARPRRGPPPACRPRRSGARG